MGATLSNSELSEVTVNVADGCCRCVVVTIDYEIFEIITHIIVTHNNISVKHWITTIDNNW